MAAASLLGSYNPFLAPDLQAKLLSIQQQQALAQKMMEEGDAPLDISNRQIGGVAYPVSPFEGLAKALKSGLGRYEQSKSNEALIKAFNPDPQSSTDAALAMGPSMGGGTGPTNANLAIANALQGGGSASGQSGGMMSPQGQQMVQALPPQAQALMAQALMTGDTKTAATLLTGFAGPQYDPQRQADIERAKQGATPHWVPGTQGDMPVYPPAQSPSGPSTGMNPMMPNLVQAESAGNPQAVSPAGAQGPAQIMPATAAQPGFGVQPLQNWDGKNPMTAPVSEQLRFSNDYLNAMQQHNGGNPQLAAASYNAGPGAVDRAGIGSTSPAQTISRLPQETQAYVPKVAGAGEPNRPLLPGEAEYAKSYGETTGKATGEATQGVASIDARIDNINGILDKMLADAKDVPYGMMPDTKLSLANQFPQTLGNHGKAADAYYRFKNNNDNLFTTELPGLVKNLGGSRLDIPIVNALKGASQIPLEANPQAKVAAIQSLKDNLEKARISSHMNRQNLSGQPSALKPSADIMTQAQQAISRGANPQSVKQRLQSNGYDVSGVGF